MKKIALSILFSLFLFCSASGQFWKMQRFEVSVGPGITQFSGDIGGFSKGKNALGLKDFTFLQTRFNFNLDGRYRILNNVAAMLNFNIGSFNSTDTRGSNAARHLQVQNRWLSA